MELSSPLSDIAGRPAFVRLDQHADVRFRGKPITDLTRDEAIEALCQALKEVKKLNSNWLPFGPLR